MHRPELIEKESTTVVAHAFLAEKNRARRGKPSQQQCPARRERKKRQGENAARNIEQPFPQRQRITNRGRGGGRHGPKRIFKPNVNRATPPTAEFMVHCLPTVAPSRRAVSRESYMDRNGQV